MVLCRILTHTKEKEKNYGCTGPCGIHFSGDFCFEDLTIVSLECESKKFVWFAIVVFVAMLVN
jgi:hypothetical protein